MKFNIANEFNNGLSISIDLDNREIDCAKLPEFVRGSLVDVREIFSTYVTAFKIIGDITCIPFVFDTHTNGDGLYVVSLKNKWSYGDTLQSIINDDPFTIKKV